MVCSSQGVRCHGAGRELDTPHLSLLVSESPGTSHPGPGQTLGSQAAWTCFVLSGFSSLVSKRRGVARSLPGPLPLLALTGEGLGPWRSFLGQVKPSATDCMA